MSKPIIEKATVDVAVNAALSAFFDDPDLAWIRKSGYMMGAYFWGLYKGLSAIANEDDIDKKVFDIVFSCMWHLDDSFNYTSIGRDYVALNDIAHRNQGIGMNGDDVKQVAEKLLTNINDKNCCWMGDIQEAQDRLNNLMDDTKYQEIITQINDLERCVRRIALLELDHKIWRGL